MCMIYSHFDWFMPQWAFIYVKLNYIVPIFVNIGKNILDLQISDERETDKQREDISLGTVEITNSGNSVQEEPQTKTNHKIDTVNFKWDCVYVPKTVVCQRHPVCPAE